MAIALDPEQIVLNDELLVLVVLLFIGIFFFSFGNSYADSANEDRTLQEWCDVSAETYFKRFYGSGYYKGHEGISLSHYISHYNRTSNMCFVLLMEQLVPNNVEEAEKYGNTTFKELREIKENRVYGSFLRFYKFKKPIKCEVLGKECNSESEWDSLVKPYMEK